MQHLHPFAYHAIEVATVRHSSPLTLGIESNCRLIDHNYNLWGRALCELDDANVSRYTKSIAWHGYGGKPQWMQKVLAAHPDAAKGYLGAILDFREVACGRRLKGRRITWQRRIYVPRFGLCIP